MASHRISVRRVLELDVPLTWQEAVAVTHEAVIVSLVNASRQGAPARIDVDSCFLTRRGDVELPHTAEREQPDAPWQLLRELLAGRETPADLEALVYGTPGQNASDELAMFSRPNRRSEIARLALRALDADEGMAGIEAAAVPAGPAPASRGAARGASRGRNAVSCRRRRSLCRRRSLTILVARLRDELATHPVPPPAPEPKPRRQLLAIRAAAAALVVVILVAAWWRWSASPPSAPLAPAAELQEAAAAVELDPSWDAVGRREADIDLGPVSAARPRLPVASDDRGAMTSLPTTPPPEGPAAPGVAGEVAPPVETATPTDAEVDALFADDSIYTTGAAGVVPPVMVLPRMPKSAFDLEARPLSPVVEVLVNQQGGVDAVRLRGREGARRVAVSRPHDVVGRQGMAIHPGAARRQARALRDAGRPGAVAVDLREAHAALVAALHRLRNPDGGWPYYAGRASRLESTCWAVLGANVHPDTTPVTNWAQPGGLLVEPATGQVNYAFNALAGLTLNSHQGQSASTTAGIVGALSGAFGAAIPQSEIIPAGHFAPGLELDTRHVQLGGAHCVVHASPQEVATGSRGGAARVAEAERVLRDRACAGGGWNFGNGEVYGKGLPAHVPPTALGVLALQDQRADRLVSDATAWLEREASASRARRRRWRSSAIALRTVGQATTGLADALATHHDQTLAFGNIAAIGMAACALDAAIQDRPPRAFDLAGGRG